MRHKQIEGLLEKKLRKRGSSYLLRKSTVGRVRLTHDYLSAWQAAHCRGVGL